MLPILFKIGNFPIHSFGIVMVIAFFASIWIAQRRASLYGLTVAQVNDLSFYTLISGVLGARIVFIGQELPYYLAHKNELFSLQFQGLTSFGGLIFGAIAVIVWALIHKIPVRRILDLAAPAFLVGHAIGRFGCLLNGCCFGGVCPPSTPWGIHVTGSEFLHHPAQVYDSLMNVLALGLLLLMERGKLKLGQLTGWTLAFHGLARFIYEFWRAGTEAQVQRGEASSTYWTWAQSHGLPITQAHVMAAILIVAGILIVATSRRSSASRTSDAQTLPNQTESNPA